MLKEALLYEKLPNRRTRCHICQRTCLIEQGRRGFCGTRLNMGGRLFSTIYGEVSTSRTAPIEIKPVYHYLPGSFAYSLGSLGCNFLCPGCQNWEISFALQEPISARTTYLSPEESIELAVRHRCQGLSWTYNEPTLWFEYTLDCARLAVERSLYTNYVTNGYMTVEALDMIGPYLDVFRVDVKGFSQDTYQKIAHIQNWEGVLKVTSRAKKHWNMHVEVVTNLIPGINDEESELKELATWISEDLSVDTPWHITRFYPRWKLSQGSPTSQGQLEKTRELALRVGLKYVYIGNLSGHPANHTYCPDCGKRVIERTEWGGVTCSLESGRCPSCGNVIAGRFT